MKEADISKSSAYRNLRELEQNPTEPHDSSSPLWRKNGLDQHKLTETWRKAWKTEVSAVPATPRNFPRFLSAYTHSYLRDERSSTIRRMLVDDFFQGLRIQDVRGHLPDSLEELLAELEKDYERSRHTHQHIKHGIDQHL